MTIQQLNHCCGSRAWVEKMLLRKPGPDLDSLRCAADEVWRSLQPSDWLEAFAAHLKIGEKKAAAKWSLGEQSGMLGASAETTASIGHLNQEYERKFGWIFIVCATGKSSEEMNRILTQRLQNSPEAELAIAAEEQLKIIHLRLAKLVAE